MMKCEFCHKEQAIINFTMTINGEQESKKLCRTCYTEYVNNTRKKQQIPNTPSDLINGIMRNVKDTIPEKHMSNFQNFFEGLTGMIFSNQEQADKNFASPEVEPASVGQTGKTKPVHLDFCEDLNELVENGKIDPVIGRDREIQRAIHILNRKTKNNPVFIGEPGVGKTAIAEGIARRIVQGNVPEKLKNKRILKLNLSSMLSDAMFRGQFEGRLERLIQTLKRNPNLILFIDELHQLMGAGAVGGGNEDASNILKPYLSRGEFQVMGATTLKEYRKIESDGALERRFQSIKVEEPTNEETFEILKGLRPRYEDFHNAKFSDEVLWACVKLADRYLFERFMPDKAIDVLDEVGARINLKNGNKHAELEELRRLEHQAREERNYEMAAQYQHRQTFLTSEISISDVESVVEEMTGIPVTKVSDTDKAKLATLQERLQEKVIGQKAAVEKVARAVKRNRMGLSKKNKPVTFLFVGPTGVGKTELTKQLNEELFGNQDSMIRMDMSEYMEAHSVSKLIGSPPGYIGHEQPGQLTEKVRRHPYSVILLDEFEKSHPDIQHIFLQVFDEGRLTDAQGKTIDFSNTVIIMTSNLGSVVAKRVGIIESTETQAYKEEVSKRFSKEFLNRLDAIIPFEHLSSEEMHHIVDLMLQKLIGNLKEKGISLTITDAAKDYLSKKGYNHDYGARPLTRLITEEIEDRIVDLMIAQDNQRIRVDVTADQKELLVSSVL